MMEAELVFNDLSITTAPTEEVARAWLTDMMDAVADLINEEINGKPICKKAIRTKIDFYNIDLIEGYYGYQEWLEDAQVDPVIQALARQIDDKSPVYEDLKIDAKAYDDFLGSEFVLTETAETVVTALGVALLHDGIAISLPSEPRWCLPKIEIVQRLYDDESEQPHKINYRVRQVSHPDQVDFAIRDWQHSLSQKIKSVNELIEQWAIVFSHLDWCEEYEKKMLPHLQDKKTLESVLHRLWQLDEVCHNWKTEPVYPMYARSESSKTMKNKKLAQMRQATCPYQGEQYFTMHCRIKPKGYRLYWFENHSRMTIGYIGPHLETATFKAQ
jgi:hypothetical protein